MSRWAVVKDSKVVNVVKWDGKGTWSPEGNTTVVPVPNGIRVDSGWEYDGQTFAAPAVVVFPVPELPSQQPDPIEVLAEAVQSASTLDDLKAALIAYAVPQVERSKKARERRAQQWAERSRG